MASRPPPASMVETSTATETAAATPLYHEPVPPVAAAIPLSRAGVRSLIMKALTVDGKADCIDLNDESMDFPAVLHGADWIEEVLSGQVPTTVDASAVEAELAQKEAEERAELEKVTALRLAEEKTRAIIAAKSPVVLRKPSHHHTFSDTENEILTQFYQQQDEFLSSAESEGGATTTEGDGDEETGWEAKVKKPRIRRLIPLNKKLYQYDSDKSDETSPDEEEEDEDGQKYEERKKKKRDAAKKAVWRHAQEAYLKQHKRPMSVGEVLELEKAGGVQLWLPKEKKLWKKKAFKVPLELQGDVTVYEEAQIEARSKLMASERIVHFLQQFWHAMLQTDAPEALEYNDFTPGHQPYLGGAYKSKKWERLHSLHPIAEPSLQSLGTLGQYRHLMLLLNAQLTPTETAAQMKKNVDADWLVDTAEQAHIVSECIDWPAFKASLFTVADMWVDTLDENAYVTFLSTMLHAVTTLKRPQKNKLRIPDAVPESKRKSKKKKKSSKKSSTSKHTSPSSSRTSSYKQQRGSAKKKKRSGKRASEDGNDGGESEKDTTFDPKKSQRPTGWDRTLVKTASRKKLDDRSPGDNDGSNSTGESWGKKQPRVSLWDKQLQPTVPRASIAKNVIPVKERQSVSPKVKAETKKYMKSLLKQETEHAEIRKKAEGHHRQSSAFTSSTQREVFKPPVDLGKNYIEAGKKKKKSDFVEFGTKGFSIPKDQPWRRETEEEERPRYHFKAVKKKPIYNPCNIPLHFLYKHGPEEAGYMPPKSAEDYNEVKRKLKEEATAAKQERREQLTGVWNGESISRSGSGDGKRGVREDDSQSDDGSIDEDVDSKYDAVQQSLAKLRNLRSMDLDSAGVQHRPKSQVSLHRNCVYDKPSVLPYTSTSMFVDTTDSQPLEWDNLDRGGRRVEEGVLTDPLWSGGGGFFVDHSATSSASTVEPQPQAQQSVYEPQQSDFDQSHQHPHHQSTNGGSRGRSQHSGRINSGGYKRPPLVPEYLRSHSSHGIRTSSSAASTTSAAASGMKAPVPVYYFNDNKPVVTFCHDEQNSAQENKRPVTPAALAAMNKNYRVPLKSKSIPAPIHASVLTGPSGPPSISSASILSETMSTKNVPRAPINGTSSDYPWWQYAFLQDQQQQQQQQQQPLQQQQQQQERKHNGGPQSPVGTTCIQTLSRTARQAQAVSVSISTRTTSLELPPQQPSHSTIHPATSFANYQDHVHAPAVEATPLELGSEGLAKGLGRFVKTANGETSGNMERDGGTKSRERERRQGYNSRPGTSEKKRPISRAKSAAKTGERKSSKGNQEGAVAGGGGNGGEDDSVLEMRVRGLVSTGAAEGASLASRGFRGGSVGPSSLFRVGGPSVLKSDNSVGAITNTSSAFVAAKPAVQMLIPTMAKLGMNNTERNSALGNNLQHVQKMHWGGDQRVQRMTARLLATKVVKGFTSQDVIHPSSERPPVPILTLPTPTTCLENPNLLATESEGGDVSNPVRVVSGKRGERKDICTSQDDASISSKMVPLLDSPRRVYSLQRHFPSHDPHFSEVPVETDPLKETPWLVPAGPFGGEGEGHLEREVREGGEAKGTEQQDRNNSHRGVQFSCKQGMAISALGGPPVSPALSASSQLIHPANSSGFHVDNRAAIRSASRSNRHYNPTDSTIVVPSPSLRSSAITLASSVPRQDVQPAEIPHKALLQYRSVLLSDRKLLAKHGGFRPGSQGGRALSIANPLLPYYATSMFIDGSSSPRPPSPSSLRSAPSAPSDPSALPDGGVHSKTYHPLLPGQHKKPPVTGAYHHHDNIKTKHWTEHHEKILESSSHHYIPRVLQSESNLKTEGGHSLEGDQIIDAYHNMTKPHTAHGLTTSTKGRSSAMGDRPTSGGGGSWRATSAGVMRRGGNSNRAPLRAVVPHSFYLGE